MKKTLFLIICIICSRVACSQIYQLITLNSGKTVTGEFISLTGDNLSCKVYYSNSIWGETSIPKDSIYSVRTLDVNFNYDEFDELLSNGKKIVEYQRIATRSTISTNHNLYISARSIQNQTILICKLKLEKEVNQAVPVLDINARGNMDFLFENGQTISRPIANSYVVIGSYKEVISYDYAYVILKDEDVLLFVNNNLTQITIDKFTFIVEKPEIIRRFILAMNDEQFF